MSFELLKPDIVVALLIAAITCAIAGALLRRNPRTRGLSAAALLGTAAAALALLVHAGTGLLVAGGSHGSFNEHRWVLLSPWGRGMQALGLGAGLGVMILAVLGTRQLISPGRRLAIIGARAGAVLAALVLFLEPAIELREVATEPNRLAVVVDTSASMALRDEEGGPRRLDRALALLSNSATTFAGWQGLHQIDFYELGADLGPTTRERLETATPGAQATRFRRSLERLRARYEDADLAGVVLISDGLATGPFAGALGGTEIDFLRTLSTRVHTVWAGRTGLKDIEIADAIADEFAFVRTVVRIEVVVRITGYGHRRVPVTLSVEGKPLRRKWVDANPDGSDTKVAFEYTPSRVGKFVFEVSTPVADDEAVAQNNRRAFIIRVIRDKFRVLQVAGQPSWDVRALRGMLKQNPNVDLISFFILRTQDDIPQARQSEMSLIPFPTQELFEQQLPSFDLIVLQNFNFRPYGLAPYLDNIRDYVKKGGGLVMLGGELSLASGGYSGTPISEVLPVGLAGQQEKGLLDTTEFRASLTEAGATHPITGLRYDPDANKKTWAKLPMLEGLNLVRSIGPDAVVLAEHPRLKTAKGNPAPVIVAREAGDGRVLVVATDTLWHWGFVAAADGEGDGRAYDQFWENATRWLIRDPDLQLLQVSSDRVRYQPGDQVTLEARIRGRDYKPLSGANIRMRVLKGSSRENVEEERSKELESDATGQARLEIQSLPPGIYRVEVSAEVSGRELTASDVFLVREASAELDRSAADPTLLEQIATATGGTYLGKAGAIERDLPLEPPRIVRVDRSSDVELWSGPWLLLLCLGFLTLEWGLRQRSGYR